MHLLEIREDPLPSPRDYSHINGERVSSTLFDDLSLSQHTKKDKVVVENIGYFAMPFHSIEEGILWKFYKHEYTVLWISAVIVFTTECQREGNSECPPNILYIKCVVDEDVNIEVMCYLFVQRMYLVKFEICFLFHSLV